MIGQFVCFFKPRAGRSVRHEVVANRKTRKRSEKDESVVQLLFDKKHMDCQNEYRPHLTNCQNKRTMVSPLLTAASLAVRSAGRRATGRRFLGASRVGYSRCLDDSPASDTSDHSNRSYSSSCMIQKSSHPAPRGAMPTNTTWSTSELRESLQQLERQILSNIQNGRNNNDTAERRRLSSLAAPDMLALDDPDLFADVTLEELESLASQKPTALKLADMYKYGRGTDMPQRIRNAQFLYKELPIRIAQRAIDLLTLPHGLSEAEPIREVASVYLQYLHRLQTSPLPTTAEQEQDFTDMLLQCQLDRTSIPTSIARGMGVWRRDHPREAAQHSQDMEEALQRFFTARVGLRFLIDHHIWSSGRPAVTAALAKVTTVLPPECIQKDDDEEEVLGCIQPNCNVVKEVRQVADMVRRQTVEFYSSGLDNVGTADDDLTMCCPRIEIVDCNPSSQHSFTYVPHHLHYMVAELLKNSVRATIRQHHEQASLPLDQLPPVRVIIAKGDEDVTIKICDRGGGIPRSRMQTIWKFAHSTANDKELDSDFGTDTVSGARIKGFGLPLARIYARYFGGELTLKSTEGYGLDAYLYLPRLGDSCENLPLRVRDSPGALDSTWRRGTE